MRLPSRLPRLRLPKVVARALNINLTVRLRVAALSLVPLFGLSIAFAVSVWTSQQITVQSALSRSNLRTALDMKVFRDQIVATQMSIEAFLLKPGDGSRAAVIAARDASNAKAAALLERDGQETSTRLPASLVKGMRTVAFDVDRVVKAEDAVGFTLTSGVGGDMTASMDALGAMLDEDVDFSDPLAVAMGQAFRRMQRNQLRFASTLASADRAAFTDSAAAMRKAVDASFQSEAKKAHIAAAIDATGKSFARWADALESVSASLSAAEMHFKALTAAADSTVASSSRAADQAGAKLSATQSNAAWLMGGVMGAVGLVCAAMGYLVGRSISGPIRRLAGAMTRMAGGDLAISVTPPRGRDEIAEMTRAVLSFRDAAFAQRRLEAEAARVRQEADQERSRNQAEREGEALQDRRVVEALGTGLGALAGGNLVNQIDVPFVERSEQLRLDFNAAVSTLNQTIVQIGGSAKTIRTRTDAIASTAADLSRRTEQQAARLEETSASLDEIAATVKSTAGHAAEARTVVSAAKGNAEASGRVVQRAVDAMAEIETSSRQIDQIVGVIDEIAFQTNLLALNAGVEAARAGEAGRGFAVVASEVRALAHRSTGAAKEIKVLIASSAERVVQGVGLVRQTGTALEQIAADVVALNTAVTAIAASAMEQSQGLDQVASAMTAMDEITKRNAAMVEETTTSANALAEETRSLTAMLGRFRLREGVAYDGPSPPRSRIGRARQGSAALAVVGETSADPDWDSF